MPCPPPSPILGNGKATGIGYGANDAIAAALGAVPGQAVSDAIDNMNCPSDCPFKSPHSIKFTVTDQGYSTTFLTFIANVLTLGTTALFGSGLVYQGWATFTWTGTAVCVSRREEIRITYP